MNRISSFIFALAAVIPACTTDNASTPGSDELAGENGDGEAAKADSPYDTFGIMTAVKVGRFECNGEGSCTHVTLARANRTSTKCADDSYAASCDVRYLDFARMSLSSSQVDAAMQALSASADDATPRVLVRGKYVHGTNPLYPNIDWVTFQVTEMWQAQMADGVVDGTFVLVHDNGVRCIDAPCPATDEARLNSVRMMAIDGLDWPAAYQNAVTSPGWLPNRVYDAMTKTDGVIVAGDRTHGTVMHLPTTLRSVNQVFLRVQ